MGGDTMSSNVVVCTIDQDLKAELKKFRYSKAKEGTAIIMKVDREKQMVVLEEKMDDCDVDELRDSLPTHQPRFIRSPRDCLEIALRLPRELHKDCLVYSF